MISSHFAKAADFGQFLEELKQAIESAAFHRLNMLKIKLVDHCNLRCPKCGHWHPQRQYTPDQLTPLTLQEWLRVAEQAIKLGLRDVRFSGGEPTLSKDLPAIAKYFSENGVRCGITTNGTCLTNDLVEKLILAGISQFTFSVDGPDAKLHDRHVGVRGAFDGLQDGLEAVKTRARLSEKSIQLGVNTVVTRHNLKHLKDTLIWAAKQSIHEITFLKLHELHLKSKLGLTSELNNLYENDILPALMDLGKKHSIRVVAVGYIATPESSLEAMPMDAFKKLPCFTAWSRAAIFPAGDVYVCCHVRHDLLYFGNIREASLESLLQGPRSNKVRRICYSPARFIPECNDCDVDLLQRLKLAKQLGDDFIAKLGMTND